MNKIVLVSLLVFLVLLMPIAQSAGPSTHVHIDDIVLSSPELQGTNFVKISTENKECFMFGEMATDVVIVHYINSYLNQGGSKYEVTHVWNFYEDLANSATDDCERAVAYGVAVHLIEDFLWHNVFVPDMIRTYMLPNLPIHPIGEGLIETYVMKAYPRTFEDMRRSLDIATDITHPNYRPDLIDFMQNAVLTPTGGKKLDMKIEILRMKEAIASPTGFYSSLFALPELYKLFAYGDLFTGIMLLAVGLFGVIMFSWKLRDWFSKTNWFIRLILGGIFIWLIIFGAVFSAGGILGGISFVSTLAGQPFDITAENYVQMTIDHTVEYIDPNQKWFDKEELDPTGFNNLGKADSEIIWIDIVFAIIVVVFVSVILYLKRRK